MDKTGKSYYGETQVLFMQTNGECTPLSLDKEGPIHDCAWSPSGKEFVVVFGYMPSKAVLFDERGRPKFDFGTGSRNTVRWSPHGRFLLLGGFGNISGKRAPRATPALMSQVRWSFGRRTSKSELALRRRQPRSLSVSPRAGALSSLTAQDGRRAPDSFSLRQPFRACVLTTDSRCGPVRTVPLTAVDLQVQRRRCVPREGANRAVPGARTSKCERVDAGKVSFRPAAAAVFPDRPMSPAKGDAPEAAVGDCHCVALCHANRAQPRRSP